MKKEKSIKPDGKDESKAVQEVDSTQDVEDIELDEDDIEVNDPGDCIGHWAECQECEMCEIQDSCQAMTKSINGEEDAENAEKK